MGFLSFEIYNVFQRINEIDNVFTIAWLIWLFLINCPNLIQETWLCAPPQRCSCWNHQQTQVGNSDPCQFIITNSMLPSPSYRLIIEVDPTTLCCWGCTLLCLLHFIHLQYGLFASCDAYLFSIMWYIYCSGNQRQRCCSSWMCSICCKWKPFRLSPISRSHFCWSRAWKDQ